MKKIRDPKNQKWFIGIGTTLLLTLLLSPSLQLPLKKYKAGDIATKEVKSTEEADWPQPRLDRLTGNGMTTVVGRVRRDPIPDRKFVVLSHNTIRGAAGASVYNAELLVNEGLL